MKEYVKPQIVYVDIRAEENLATRTGCKIGECHDEEDGSPIYLTPGS